MKLYSYVIPRDYGFAPNPYFNYCTLATCKPRIRKSAQAGDWVAAYGAAGTSIRGKLVVLMQISEVVTFDEYWEDARFESKRPVFNKGIIHMYGDNIYHHVDDRWMQEPSHHSMKDGSINYANNRKTEYNNIIALFEKSDCEQADALRALLQEESRTMEMLAELLTELVHMLQKASADTSHVEDKYSVNRVKG